MIKYHAKFQTGPFRILYFEFSVFVSDFELRISNFVRNYLANNLKGKSQKWLMRIP